MSKKYEFVDGDTVTVPNGQTLHRIRAVMSFGDVDPGEIGGYVSSHENLSHEGDAWVYGDAQVSGKSSRTPIQISGLHWPVTILDQHMQIGCQLHSLHEWSSFDDAQIAAMDGREALRFWRLNKDALLSIARADGRNFDPVEPAAVYTEPTEAA